MRHPFPTRLVRRLVIAVLATAVAMAGLAGCGALPLGSQYDLHVTNGTTLDADVRINGTSRGIVTAGGSLDLPAAANGALPWRVELVSPAGTTWVMADVTAGSTDCGGSGGGAGGCAVVTARAHLACGDIVLWSGDTPPPIPPIAPGTGLPCE